MLINPQLAVINGVFVCKFSQLAVSPPNFEPSYDVTAKNYFLILATGEATEKGETVVTGIVLTPFSTTY